MTQAPLSPEAFAAKANVSRETLDKLCLYAALLEKWQKRINLVGPSTLPDLWRRHFLDSLQAAPFIGERIVDLGSGAGFPGLVLSIVTGKPAILIESDQRKCAFLREIVRSVGAAVEIVAKRIEEVNDVSADTVTARALASLSDLAAWSAPILERSASSETRAVFLKGQNIEVEIETLSKMWDFDILLNKSMTDPSGVVAVFKKLRRKA